MKTFAIARAYTDLDKRALMVFIRFGKRDQIQHVGRKESATLFPTREEAAERCPAGYFVFPKPKPKKDALGRSSKRQSPVKEKVDTGITINGQEASLVDLAKLAGGPKKKRFAKQEAK